MVDFRSMFGILARCMASDEWHGDDVGLLCP
jgi:hypothetical protein